MVILLEEKGRQMEAIHSYGFLDDAIYAVWDMICEHFKIERSYKAYDTIYEFSIGKISRHKAITRLSALAKCHEQD